MLPVGQLLGGIFCCSVLWQFLGDTLGLLSHTVFLNAFYEGFIVLVGLLMSIGFFLR